MSKYAVLDDLIVERLQVKPATFAELLSGDIRKECDTLVMAGYAFRVLDRRLQALRKKRVVYFDRATGWNMRVVE